MRPGAWQTLALAEIVPTPWRNGGGTTRELLAWPNSHDWLWRVSIAEVASAGPFSHFAGVQRWLAIIAGAGIALTIDDKTQNLSCDTAPMYFSGTSNSHCELLSGTISDCNLMLREDAGSMRRINDTQTLDFKADFIGIFANDGDAIWRFGAATHSIPSAHFSWLRCNQGKAKTPATMQVQANNALLFEVSLRSATRLTIA
jgi:uncharacterized protein